MDLTGEYFSDPERQYLHPEDRISGTVRPWGLGPRAPLYVISPWSRGGWVNSQVFDHTSLPQFLEKRFGIAVTAISPWHRAISGDLTSAFDFATPNLNPFPELPSVANSAAVIAEIAKRPQPAPPDIPERLFQEPGIRRSRPLPYELHVHAIGSAKTNTLTLSFRNSGGVGAVLHVYDKLHLDRILRRYTVESGKTLTEDWPLQENEGRYDLWVYGPNGFVREFRGTVDHSAGDTQPNIQLQYDIPNAAVRLVATNHSLHQTTLQLRGNAYGPAAPQFLHIPQGHTVSLSRSVTASHNWYDFTVTGDGFEQRFAGRMETGHPAYTDPAV